MAPTKKSKGVNKGFASTSDSSPTKDDKVKQKKRKLSDMLGPQWSKHEIERFYEAYRKHGQDWKKVAVVVRSRSIEMVEALYNMNRAYLSLPEGTASVVGLIAMMTDHYNVLDGAGSEKDSEGPEAMARKIQKKSKAKGLLDSSRDDSRRQTASPNNKCLSLLKIQSNGLQPRIPVKKRTPRVPVSCLEIHPNMKSRDSVINANGNGIPHGDSVSKEAWKTSNSPHGSRTTYRKLGDSRTSHVSTREDVVSNFQVRKAKNDGFAIGLKPKEGIVEHNEANNGNLALDSVDSGRSALADYKKGKKGMKEDIQHPDATLFDEIREAYKYAEKGSRSNGFDGKGAKISTSTSEGERKKRKIITSEDELAACDALQTLAELSSMMPYLDAETVEDAGESMVGRDTRGDKVSHSNVALSDEKAGGVRKKKRISKVSKVQKAETCDHSRRPVTNESVADEEVKSADSSGHASAVSKRCKSSLISPDVSSSNDLHAGEMEVAASSTQVHAASQVVNSTQRKCRRKKNRAFHLKDRNYAPAGFSIEVLPSLHDGLLDIKGKVLHCLSCHEVRRWCVYEWFYSAIDYPWFAKREFVDYLNHVGLGHIPKLTRVELGVIRSSLGKPRRFSERFLQVERGKLEQYRESVRAHYVRAGRGEGLPTDLACPLKVGQHVLAIHPKTRECHNGSVLTVDRDNYLVQFHRPDLGVEPVMDIDCMPLNPLENMPEALKKQKMPLDYRCSQIPKVNGSITPTEEHMKNVDHYMRVSSSRSSIPNDVEAKPACLSSHAKVLGNGNFKATSRMLNHSHNIPQMQFQGRVRPIPGFIASFDKKILDQHSACPEKTHWPVPVIDSVGLNDAIHSSNVAASNCQEIAFNVAEIVEGSKNKALIMVDTAIKAMSIMKEGEDAFGRISDALNDNNKIDCTTNCRVSTLMSSNTAWGSFSHQNPVTSSTSGPQLAYGGLNVQSAVGDSAPNDFQVPSELIASCVATLIMIQTCTERQYPPAEVAQILDNASTSLHPCSPQNLSLFREIEMCMGRIKTQILALIPT